jgi:hypothetical protein
VTTAAQPNITSVGTLTSVSVTGAATVGNVTGGNVQATARMIIPVASSDPASPVTGQLYYNSSTGALRVWTGFSWDSIA